MIFTDKNLYVLGETLDIKKLVSKKKLDTFKITKKEHFIGISFNKNNEYIMIETDEEVVVLLKSSLTATSLKH